MFRSETQLSVSLQIRNTGQQGNPQMQAQAATHFVPSRSGEGGREEGWVCDISLAQLPLPFVQHIAGKEVPRGEG